jgi:uncharacterized protein (TIGR02145 family)
MFRNSFLIFTTLLFIISCAPSDKIVDPQDNSDKTCPDVPTVYYEGKTYNTVQIGSQCWLKENLDVGIMIQGVDTMSNNGIIEKYCYDNDQSNCDTYGALYQWEEAMQYSFIENAQGICPPGWNIPSFDDFELLRDAAEDRVDNLLALGQEGSYIVKPTDATGFSGLLSGHNSNILGEFSAVGGVGTLWGSTVYNNEAIWALDLGIDMHEIRITTLGGFIYGLKPGFGVRCIKHGNSTNNNLPPTTPSNPIPPDDATDISINQSLSWSCSDPEGDPITYDIYFSTDSNPQLAASSQSSNTYFPGSLETWTKYYWKIVASDNQGNSKSGPLWEFTTKESSTSGSVCLGASKTVEYQGKVYNTVLIGNQCWLKENLDIGTMITSEGPEDYQTNNGIIEKFCYDNDEGNCNVYGGLYQWDEAMQYITTEGAQGICPDGWHIPTLDEFESLKEAVNNDGNSLKAIGEGSGDGTGTNTSGFSALLAGDRENDGSFYYPGIAAYFWSSKNYTTSSSIRLILSGFDENIDLTIGDRRNGFSVRCLED